MPEGWLFTYSGLWCTLIIPGCNIASLARDTNSLSVKENQQLLNFFSSVIMVTTREQDWLILGRGGALNKVSEMLAGSVLCLMTMCE